MKVSISLLVTLAAITLLVADVRALPAPPDPPDLTAGGQRDEKSADFNLGATGARGWVFGWHEASYNSRQILVTEVADDSPAADVLQVGDVILGVDGKPFTKDARRSFGEALGTAEATGKLPLLVWRSGKKLGVTLEMEVLGPYSDTWPYDCRKSEKILESGCEWIASTELKGIPGDVNALALLASGEEKYLAKIKEYARSVASPDMKLDFQTTNGHFCWGWGYRTIFLAEYYAATGDEYVLSALRKHAREIARCQSRVGTWGHQGAMPEVNRGELHGRLGGYGAVNAAGLPCYIGMVLAAEKCGIDDDDEINEAIRRSTRFFSFFANKGSIPYGFHDPRMVDHDDNGKNCMGAFAMDLLGRGSETRHFARWALASYDSRELGHTGNFFGYLWGPTGVVRIGPEALSTSMKLQQWYYDLARDHKGRFHYQGQAGAGRQNYSGWDCTGVYLIAYALPRQKTFFSGRGARSENVLGEKGIAESIVAGAGYTVWDRGHAHYLAKSVDGLFESLHSWSPLTRQRAAKALAEKPADYTSRLIEMLTRGDQDAKFGACQAIEQLGTPCAPAVDALIALLDEKDLWLRVSAAKALSAIGGDRAREAAPKLLDLLAAEDPDDTLMIESRFVGEALFKKRGRDGKAGLLAESIEGADYEKLLAAARRILQNPCGGARASVTSLYQTMTPAQLKPIMPEIIDAVERPGWSVMFSNTVRENGLAFLAENRIEEGLTQLMTIMDPDNGRGNEGYWFAPRVVRYFEHYRGAAKPYLPKLKENAAKYKVNRMLEKNERFHEQMRKTIEMIEKDDDPPKLISWQEL
ncbi:MAG: HEAT repeat domain-containing protein [Candidatus Nealsonbacteria bacterium]|nr:HEAT repeat domain-containing protein [Candidatus Nealsonbacteria bacterium]